MVKKNEMWMQTLVQHSAWVMAEKPGFKRAVETQLVTSEAAAKRIRDAGGVLFPPEQADSIQHAINYPSGVRGLYPAAVGRFSRARFFGSPIYLPTKEEWEELLADYRHTADVGSE